MIVIRNKKKFIRGITIILIGLVIIIAIICFIISSIISLFTRKEDKQQDTLTNETIDNKTTQVSTSVNDEILEEWNLKLVNSTNSISKDYVPELEELDDGIMFDKRAISYLKEMINAMYAENIKSIWVQSGYRSYEKQEELFNNKVTYYKNEGYSQEEAEELAQKVVQRPEMSEHNLGLAVDFNTVTNDFEETEAFKWLQENAQDYGFILRYPENKEDITSISYESWHWRYVGIEHAKIIKEKGYCLEEYIEYLKGNYTEI